MSLNISLNNREKAVWKLHKQEGMSISQIAAELKLSGREVEHIIKNVRSIKKENQFLRKYELAYQQEMTLKVEYDDLMLVREALLTFQFIVEEMPDELIDGLGATPYATAALRAEEMLQVINCMKADTEKRLYPNRATDEAEPQSQKIV